MSSSSAPESSNVLAQRFSVAFEYSVSFTRDLLAPSNPLLAMTIRAREPERRHRLLVVVDDGVWQAWPKLGARISDYCAAHASSLDLVAPPLVVPGGEQVKQSASVVERLQSELYRLGIDRHSFVVIIGGGAVLDAAGYAAATTHRGVRVVRVPTTVLAQNDAGIGVKNGINAFGSKNFLGSFAPPFAVINDASFLATLPARDSRAGMAEAVKVGLIRDQRFFEWMIESQAALSRFESAPLEALIRRAAEIHLQHIATGGDPFELGSARPLDFGHWAAHKLEGLTKHRVRHGEAVAIGMMLDSRYSVLEGLLPEAQCDAIYGLLTGLGFRLWDDALESLDADEKPALLTGLREFREHLGGELTVTLLRRIGEGVEVHEMHEDNVMASLAWLKRKDGERCA